MLWCPLDKDPVVVRVAVMGSVPTITLIFGGRSPCGDEDAAIQMAVALDGPVVDARIECFRRSFEFGQRVLITLLRGTGAASDR